MDFTQRKGNRKSREKFAKRRVPELGYYYIVTDTKETEKNYIYGLRDALPNELQHKLRITVIKTKTKNLVEEATNLANLDTQYTEVWIVFDRDEVQDFDKIIIQAKHNNINVGWTNPCIEEWFSAYFGSMPTYKDSVSCCSGFEKTFFKNCKQKYSKSDRDIYKKLNRFGDEEDAIKLAQEKLNEHMRNDKNKPSEMCPCTTIHKLIQEIKFKK